MSLSIQKISQTITKAIETARVPLTYIPAVILVCSAVQRPGLSAKTVAANIIRRQSEAGAPIGRAADGSQNIAEAMEVVRVEEIFKALKMDARVDGAIKAGTAIITGTCQTPTGAGTITGTIANNLSFNAIIR